MTLTDYTLKMLLFRDPTLKQTIERYRYCKGLLPEALWELDTVIKARGLNEDLDDDPEMLYLRANVELIWQELDITEEILANALQAEHRQFESR